MKRPRAYSTYTLEAAQLLGERIRLGRRQRRWSQTELAERAGITPPTLRKVERGDPSVGLGTAFALASLVGVTLFEEDHARLELELDRTRSRSALLLQRVRSGEEVDDDF